MAKEPQTPLDEELARREQDADPQSGPKADSADLEGQLEKGQLEKSELEQGELEEVVGGVDQAADVDPEIPEESLHDLEQDPEILALATRVEELEQTVADAKEQQLRAAAEAQNVRRRAELDAEKARKFALEKFVKELLPVVDSLEKALEAMQDGASESHREGVSMTLKMHLGVLEKFGVEVVEPHGEPFDPHHHEAMAMVPNPEMEPNSVMEVMQKGYLLNGRLVRPAMVVVSQAAG